ncbi:MAG: transporter, partial [Jatrophihabitans sp.]|nr:transporter [Jatrophihabitans sp.]
MGALLDVQNVSRSFGSVHAVQDASFSVAEDSITALIGPNGSGKTTLFNVITGYLRPDRGS